MPWPWRKTAGNQPHGIDYAASSYAIFYRCEPFPHSGKGSERDRSCIADHGSLLSSYNSSSSVARPSVMRSSSLSGPQIPLRTINSHLRDNLPHKSKVHPQVRPKPTVLSITFPPLFSESHTQFTTPPYSLSSRHAGRREPALHVFVVRT